MVHSRRFLIRMGAFLGAVIVVIAVLHRGLGHAFINNIPLNCLILAILLTGIALNFRQVVVLEYDAEWLTALRQGRRVSCKRARESECKNPESGQQTCHPGRRAP